MAVVANQWTVGLDWLAITVTKMLAEKMTGCLSVNF